MMALNLLFLLLLLRLQPSHSSSSDRHSYNVADPVPLLVNKVGPFTNPSETYRYYDLPFCFPDNAVERRESLGEVLNGDRIMSSFYKLDFRVEKKLESVCKKKLSKQDIEKFRNAVKNDYYYQMYYDDLPLWGFIGKTEDFVTAVDNNTTPRYYLFKNIQFEIFYNDNNVIEIKSFSDPLYVVDISENVKGDVDFTYSVSWHKTSVSFNRRAEKYLKNAWVPQHSNIHWFSIVNALVVSMLLIGFLAVVFMRSIKNDLIRCSRGDTEDDKEIGWKNIHGDVFRYPPFSSLMSAVLGTGTQLLSIALLLLILGIGGVFYPYNHGRLCTSIVILYAVTSTIVGYVSRKYDVQWELRNRAYSILLAVFLFPGPFFAVFLVLNFIAMSYNATAALPFGTVIAVLCLWCFVAIPLLLFGHLLGSVLNTEFLPCRSTKRIPSEIPQLAWYRKMLPQMFLAGFLPFTIIFIELHYVLSSIWGHKTYAVYGVWFVLFIILILVTALLGMGLAYFQLSVEDYRWWWRSFLCGGSPALFIYGYCCYFYLKSEMSSLLQLAFFFGYNACMCYAIFLMLGTISFQATFFFIRRIYGTFKSD